MLISIFYDSLNALSISQVILSLAAILIIGWVFRFFELFLLLLLHIKFFLVFANLFYFLLSCIVDFQSFFKGHVSFLWENAFKGSVSMPKVVEECSFICAFIIMIMLHSLPFLFPIHIQTIK